MGKPFHIVNEYNEEHLDCDAVVEFITEHSVSENDLFYIIEKLKDKITDENIENIKSHCKCFVTGKAQKKEGK